MSFWEILNSFKLRLVRPRHIIQGVESDCNIAGDENID